MCGKHIKGAYCVLIKKAARLTQLTDPCFTNPSQKEKETGHQRTQRTAE